MKTVERKGKMTQLRNAFIAAILYFPCRRDCRKAPLDIHFHAVMGHFKSHTLQVMRIILHIQTNPDPFFEVAFKLGLERGIAFGWYIHFNIHKDTP